MMPIVIAAERDLVKSLMVRLSLPQFCRQCGAVHPDKAEQVAELERVIRSAVGSYRVRHVLDGGDALIEDPPPSSTCLLPSDDQPESPCCDSDVPDPTLGFCGGEG